MVRYTAGLMDYTRLETNKQKANLNEIITDVLSFLVVQRRFSRNTIKTELDSALPILELDADQIAQLLLNMLNNASDAISETKQNCGVIEIKTALSGDSVVLQISDNGAGMSNEVKEKLFNKQLSTKSSGHGYGLVTCGKIIKNHGGKIEIISQPGAGATFKIYFPLK
jgi:signal transduction histidine kinase